MIQTLCILGRQPALGIAELESLFGASVLRPIGNYAALLDVEPAVIDFSRLGGTVKFCKVLTTLDTTDWSRIQNFLETVIVPHTQELPEGKMKLGLSVYGLNIGVKQLNATALGIKKVIKNSGRSIRVVPNNELYLNSAQVLHNQLTSQLGWELVFVRDGQKTIIAQNIAEQDIEAYARRDQGRPKRDAQVGMLPPKLAQIIINLACGNVKPADITCDVLEYKDDAILDPFCGTGVVLQESLLMGYKAYGTDLEPRMIDYSEVNLDWISNIYKIPKENYKLEQGDATNHIWQFDFKFIAGETYLGRPFNVLPTPQILQETISDTNLILKRSLQNISRQIKSGTRLCLALPAWKLQNGFKHLPLLDSLTDMGYNRLSLVHAGEKDLIYHRDGQVVARELVILIKK